MKTFLFDGNCLTTELVRRILDEQKPVGITDESRKAVEKSREVIESIINSGKTVYGVNTGFGKFSDVRISDEQIELLQQNIVRSHAAGVGEPLPETAVKIIVLLKANGLAKGYSGVRTEIIDTLINMYNRDVLPVIPSQGSVGASGDLAPLAHLALVMIGEGEAILHGQRMPGGEAMLKAGIAPVQLKSKEGLAILNGTQVMTGIAVYNLLHAMNIIETAEIAGAMTTEALFCTDTAFDERIHVARNQTGQIQSAEKLRTLVKDSPMIKAHRDCSNVQDAYSVRCMPQVHGASRDAVRYVKEIVEREMNAATDNPLIFTGEQDVLSGGNFHGQPVALAMDFLSMAMSEIGSISERRIAWMMDPHLNYGLPAFLAMEGGINSGYMIAQYTAAALASENKTLCHPACVDSIPTSANKEDHVSMGTIGARKCSQIINNTINILAIEWLCAAQAAEFRDPPVLAPMTDKAFRLLRSVVPFLDKDGLTHDLVRKASDLIRNGEIVRSVWKA